MKYKNLEEVQKLCERIRPEKEVLEELKDPNIEVIIARQRGGRIATYEPYVENKPNREYTETARYVNKLRELIAEKIASLEAQLDLL